MTELGIIVDFKNKTNNMMGLSTNNNMYLPFQKGQHQQLLNNSFHRDS